MLLKKSIISFKLFAHFKRIVAFVQNPSNLQYRRFSTSKKLKDVGIYFFIIDIIITSIIVCVLALLHYFNFFNGIEDKEIFKDNKTLEFIIVVILAPLLEEGFFRFPLCFFVDISYFKWLVYAFCFLFAGIHISNFEYSKASVWVLPFIILPQLWAGFLLSYTRLKYGIWYAVLLHAIHNFWAFFM